MLRRATLVNQIDVFMPGILATGYTPQEIDQAAHEVLAGRPGLRADRMSLHPH